MPALFRMIGFEWFAASKGGRNAASLGIDCPFHRLLLAYRRSKYRLMWGGLCFAGLTINILLLVLDELVYTTIDLSSWRTSVALVAMAVLLYGLIWGSE